MKTELTFTGDYKNIIIAVQFAPRLKLRFRKNNVHTTHGHLQDPVAMGSFRPQTTDITTKYVVTYSHGSCQFL